MKLLWKKEEHECSTTHSLIKDSDNIDTFENQGKSPMTPKYPEVDHPQSTYLGSVNMLEGVTPECDMGLG